MPVNELMVSLLFSRPGLLYVIVENSVKKKDLSSPFYRKCINHVLRVNRYFSLISVIEKQRVHIYTCIPINILVNNSESESPARQRIKS